MAINIGWVRKLLSRLMPKLLERGVIYGVAEIHEWVRKLFSRLLPEFIGREAIHGVGGI